MSQRKIDRVVAARALREGAGVVVRRTVGLADIDHLDPFLLLDEFRSSDPAEYRAGFPRHPHRGIETVTYVLEGRVRHGDSLGNGGTIVPGAVQWMTAGRGIVHEEMPEGDPETGSLWGYQLWVNLPASEKMCEPRYREISPGDVPRAFLAEGIEARVIAGALAGARGPVQGLATDPLYADITAEAGRGGQISLPAEHAVFVYVMDGHGHFGSARESVGPGTLLVLGEGDALTVQATGAPVQNPERNGEPALRFLLGAGRPLGEPIVRWGPFVMNTQAEIRQALEDFRSGRLHAP